MRSDPCEVLPSSHGHYSIKEALLVLSPVPSMDDTEVLAGQTHSQPSGLERMRVMGGSGPSPSEEEL